jgi:hypothetical protein
MRSGARHWSQLLTCWDGSTRKVLKGAVRAVRTSDQGTWWASKNRTCDLSTIRGVSRSPLRPDASPEMMVVWTSNTSPIPAFGLRRSSSSRPNITLGRSTACESPVGPLSYQVGAPHGPWWRTRHRRRTWTYASIGAVVLPDPTAPALVRRYSIAVCCATLLCRSLGFLIVRLSGGLRST